MCYMCTLLDLHTHTLTLGHIIYVLDIHGYPCCLYLILYYTIWYVSHYGIERTRYAGTSVCIVYYNILLVGHYNIIVYRYCSGGSV